jgi:hypothetical protein
MKSNKRSLFVEVLKLHIESHSLGELIWEGILAVLIIAVTVFKITQP